MHEHSKSPLTNILARSSGSLLFFSSSQEDYSFCQSSVASIVLVAQQQILLLHLELCFQCMPGALKLCLKLFFFLCLEFLELMTLLHSLILNVVLQINKGLRMKLFEGQCRNLLIKMFTIVFKSAFKIG